MMRGDKPPMLGRRKALALAAGAGCSGLPCAAGQAQAQAAVVQPSQAPMLLPDTDMHVAAVRAIAVTRDGAVVATGSADRSVRIWSGRTGALMRRWRPPLGENGGGSVTGLDFSPDGRLLYVSATDWFRSPRGIIHIYDTASGSLRRTVQSPSIASWQYFGLVVAPQGGLFALPAETQGLMTWSHGEDVVPRLIYPDQPDPADPTLAVAFSPDGETLASVSQRGVLRLFGVSGTRVQGGASPVRPLSGQPFSLAFSRDGRRLAVGFASRRSVTVIELGSGRSYGLEPPAGLSPGNLAMVAWGTEADGAEWLFASGTVQQGDGSNLVFAWLDGRPGTPLSAAVARDSIAAMVRNPAGGVVFGSSDAAWGKVAVSRGGRRLDAVVTPSERLDFREVASRRWGVDDTGGVVEFQAMQRGQPPMRFDLDLLRLEDNARVPRPDLRWARGTNAGRLPADLQRIGDRRLSADAGQQGNTVLLGTQEKLILQDRTGQELARQPIATPAWAVAISGNGQVAVAAHGDGTIRWYGLLPQAPLHELGGLFVHAGRRRWVAWRNDGHFACSEFGGETLVGLHENGQFVSGRPEALTSKWITIDQEFRRLYDIYGVRRMLMPGPHWQPGEQAEAGLPSPVAEQLPTLTLLQVCPSDLLPEGRQQTRMIAEQDNQDDVCLPVGRDLASATGPFRVPATVQALQVRLDLSHSARPVTVDAFVNGVNTGRSVHMPGSPAEKLVPLPLTDDQVRVEFRAYGPGGGFTRTAPIVITRPNRAEVSAPPPPTLHVLAVGIDRYGGDIPPLRFGATDAATFVETIRQVLPSSYGQLAPPVLLDNENASLDAVRAALEALGQRMRRQDAAMIYLAGHGVAVGGREVDGMAVDGNYAFVPVDVRDSNAALQRGEGCLPSSEIVRLLSNIRATRAMLLLDTCFSNAVDLQASGRLGKETGRWVLAASGSREQALDSYDGKNGVFAYAVKEALTTLPSGGGSVLDASLFCIQVRDRVQTLATRRQRGHKQEAHFQALGDIRSFPVAQPR